ncbi:hypothetical protein V7183_23955 [Bacillus sp. JJ1127]|uniref:hypothetical protein n=1 Tax=Bacillus sp. JJ1127 TaxID=3122952 RepID=UPI002FFF787C
MFDTIHIKVSDIKINENIINQYKIKDDFTYLDKNKSEITKHELRIDYIYIKYYTPIKKLTVETSVAEVMNNGKNNLVQSEFYAERFWINLNSILYKYLKITIPKEEWTVSRLDITYDIKTKNIDNPIQKISKLHFPKYNKSLYNDNESVMFSAKSSKIVVYNKQKQYISSKETTTNIQAAANILRIEIRPSRYTVNQYDSSRKAVNLLTKQYADYISGKYHYNDILSQIKKRNRTKTPAPLSANNIKSMEIIAGFMYLIDTYGEKAVKESMTLSTFKNRKRLVKKTSI